MVPIVNPIGVEVSLSLHGYKGILNTFIEIFSMVFFYSIDEVEHSNMETPKQWLDENIYPKTM